MADSTRISLLAIVGFVLLAVSFVPNVDAALGAGVSLTEVSSKKICGVDFCGEEEWSVDSNALKHFVNLYETQNTLEKKLIETDGDEVSFQFGGTLQSKLPSITKTISLSGGTIMVQYSDGTWQLLSSPTSALTGEIKNDPNDDGIKFSYGGQLGENLLDNPSAPKKVGTLRLTESQIIIPQVGQTGLIDISGDTGSLPVPNILISFTFPTNFVGSFIIPVNNDGTFVTKYFYDHNTKPGTYLIQASYQDFLIGSGSFIALQADQAPTSIPGSTGVIEAEEQIPPNSIKVLEEKITLPKSTFQATTIQLEGQLEDYFRGEVVLLSFVFPDDSIKKQKVFATKDGFFETLFFLEKNYPKGQYEVIVYYRNNEITRASFTVLGYEDDFSGGLE